MKLGSLSGSGLNPISPDKLSELKEVINKRYVDEKMYLIYPSLYRKKVEEIIELQTGYFLYRKMERRKPVTKESDSQEIQSAINVYEEVLKRTSEKYNDLNDNRDSWRFCLAVLYNSQNKMEKAIENFKKLENSSAFYGANKISDFSRIFLEEIEREKK